MSLKVNIPVYIYIYDGQNGNMILIFPEINSIMNENLQNSF